MSVKSLLALPLRTSSEISEIFSSLQGEGIYLGVRQIFIRFGRCNMHCVYCDEVEKMKKGSYRAISLAEVIGEVDRLNAEEGGHHSVSLTGGEPLMYSSFLDSLLPELKRRGLKVYLETNGTYPLFLRRHLEKIDIVAMDLKPPSSTLDRAFWDEHREFLKVAARKDVFIKVVVTGATTLSDIRKSIRIVEEVNPSIPFVLQPESEMTGISVKALHKIREFLIALGPLALEDVRVVPQMHKVWGVR